jgi:hypothetical protein
MPRPPILPNVNWQLLFDNALEYDAWIRQGESEDNRRKMDDRRASLALPADLARFLTDLPKKVHVVAIAEDWCGDVVRHVPAMQKLAESSPRVHLRFIAREDSPETFVRFLTNGGEAIPKFVFLSDRFVECGNWGPMPWKCREYIARGKACGDTGAARKLVSQAYEADPNLEVVMRELAELLDVAASVTPNPRAGLLRSH